MFKIIETMKSVSNDLISTYTETTNFEKFVMPLVDGKYSIESINEYTNHFSLKPADQEVRVGIITDGHLLSEYHQNKLLKIFEDSSDDEFHLILIDRSDRLLDTILSRAIISKELDEYSYLENKLHDFAKDIIITGDQYRLLSEDSDYFQTLYKVSKFVSNGQIDNAIVQIGRIKLDNVRFGLFINCLNKIFYETKRIDLLEQAFETEMRCKFQVNLNVQALNLLIKVKNSKEYYERSNWS